MTAVVVEHASKRYGESLAVSDVTFSVAPGQVLCLLGPNGAGKTSTLKMILGLVTPTSGRVMVCGIDVSKDPAGARQNLAYIPEMVSLHGNFSGMENLEYFSALVSGQGVPAEQLEDCLDRAGLQRTVWTKPLSGYSKGMRQKVGVAIALAKGANVLVLDEPTSGLDPKASNDFTALISDLANKGCAVVSATHDLFRARDMASDIIILKSGSIARRLDPARVSYEEVDKAYLDVFQDA